MVTTVTCWAREVFGRSLKRANLDQGQPCVANVIMSFRYKMSYFENSVRVPLLVHHPKAFQPHRVSANVSTLDILPTLVDLVGTKLWPRLPMDGSSLLPHLQNVPGGSDTVFAEYCGEGTIAPMMMIRRGPWKYITCPADDPQLFNLASDPAELHNLAVLPASDPLVTPEVTKVLEAFHAEAAAKWNFDRITEDVLLSQRQRRLVWSALKVGKFTSWDYNPDDDGRKKYIRSHIPLDDLELMARFPAVDANGRELGSKLLSLSAIPHQAGSHGE